MKILKHLCFIGIVVLLASTMVSCDFFSSQGDDGTPAVQYFEDGRVTLRIDGKGGPDRNMSRALTDALAKSGHDFYEVVFVNGATVARASWDIGSYGVIQGVPRGVDYGTADKAILFAGRKMDKTLLGVGLLTHVDGGTGTTVTTTTRTVTFTVAALEAGVNFLPAGATDTFLTANEDGPDYEDVSDDNTTLEKATFQYESLKNAVYEFPMYRFDAGEEIAATYTIDCTGTIADYLLGIKVIGGADEATIRDPRFQIESNGAAIPIYLPGPYADETAVTLTNNITADDPFENVIELLVDTTAYAADTTVGLISFAFDIPVYAINKTESPDVPKPITWHIKPGIESYFYDLDNGKSGRGGAVLLGIGEIETNYLIVIPK